MESTLGPSASGVGGAGAPTAAYPPQSTRLYLNLSALWFAVNVLWTLMLTMVLQRRVEEILALDGRAAQKDLYLGWILALGALISTVVCLVVGTLSDRARWRMGKRRPYVIAGIALSVPGILFLPLAHTVPLLLLDFCLIQITVNTATAAYQALMPDTVPKERQGTASAYMGLALLLGQIGGFILGGVLIAREGGLWVLAGSMAGVLVIAMLWVVFTIPEHSAEKNPAPQTGPLATLVDSFRVRPREHPDFFWLIASRFLINMGFYTATQFLMYYISDTLRAPNPERLFMLTGILATVCALAGNLPAGILSDRVSKKRVVYVTCAVTVASAALFVSAHTVPVAIVAACLYGCGNGAFQAVDWAFATNLLPKRDAAKYLGVWHIAFTVPQVVAPAIGGPIAFYFNAHVAPGFGYRAVLSLVILYFALGTLLIRPIRERAIAKDRAA